MAFGKKKKSSSKGGDKKKKSRYRQIGSIWESDKFEGVYGSIKQEKNKDGEVDEYWAGALLFHDKKTGKYYQVKGFSLFEPNKGAPESLVYNIVLNLDSEFQVEELDGGDAEDTESESEEESEDNEE